MANDNGSGWFVAGFIVGGLVGFAAGLLMAPQAGEETRAQLSEKGIELKGRAEELAEELREKGQVVLEEQKVRIEEALAEGKEAAAKKKEELVAKLEEERGKGKAKVEA